MRFCDFRRWLRAAAWLFAAGILCAGVVRAGSADEPLVESKDGTAVRDGDAAALAKLAAKPGKGVWLIRLSKAQYATPPARSCVVYLQPEVCHERLRRGECRQGLDSGESQAESHWEVSPRPRAYAMVPAPAARFTPGTRRPGALDGPFIVMGTVSDEDLVQTVDLVRSQAPAGSQMRSRVTHVETNADGSVEERVEPGRGQTFSIDRGLPVSSVTAKDADHIEISTSTGNGSGQQIDLQREAGRWKIVRVWQWNA